jgi:RNA-directed DNA polymerase
MKARFEAFALTLHPQKTRVLEFGRFASERRKRRGDGKPETFAFLGFVHLCGQDRCGRFQLWRKTRSDRMRNALRAIKEQLRKRMHEPVQMQGAWLKRVVSGYFQYHAVPTNVQALSTFRARVVRIWWRTLRRRSQKDRTRAKWMEGLADYWLPKPRIIHPWPDKRFAASHSR